MWKDFSWGFIRQNRASSVSVMAAAFISALFLSLLCTLAYNFWTYETESIVLEEGDWQGRITGALDDSDLEVIENFADVERAVVNEELSEGEDTVVDVYFDNMRTVYREMPLIAQKLDLDESAVSYHTVYLSQYLIHDPQDETPPLLLPFFAAVLIVVCVSLILIIHNSFALSMNARIHQLGIFSSVGASPGQIRTCLIQEAMALCAVPALAGILLGIGISCGIMQAVNRLAGEIAGRHEAVFQYHPLIFAATVLAVLGTVLISAWIPAGRLSRMTPLQAIQGAEENGLKKKKHSRFLSRLFGIEGELAGNELKARKKAFRTSTLSLTLSFLAFTIILCFFTLSGISTNHTYFERYQDAWDVMVTVRDTDLEEFSLNEEIRNLPGTGSSVVYQKAEAVCSVPEAEISDEAGALGDLELLTENAVSLSDGVYEIKAPIVIMDDESFAEYCVQNGLGTDQTGVIVFNQLWDSVHSNFRYKEYVSFVKEDAGTVLLKNPDGETEGTEVPVLAYTQEPPVLREEYDNYSLVQFMPVSMWEQISDQIGNAEDDMYIRVLAGEGAELEELNALEDQITEILGQDYTCEIENRIQERIDNDAMIRGYMTVTSAFCGLLALIGIANVFSNTLGFLRQRKREFARYESVGMTPAGLRKMFFVEALVTAGRPVVITVPLTVVFAGLMIRASSLDPAEFLAEAPILPIVIFMLAIFGFVALAYYIGGKRVMKCSLAEALRDDMVD